MTTKKQDKAAGWPMVPISWKPSLPPSLPCALGKADKDTVVWKAVWLKFAGIYRLFYTRPGLAKLLIKRGTPVILTSDKCRAAEAKVLAIYTKGRRPTTKKALATVTRPGRCEFVYEPGTTVRPRNSFDYKPTQCSRGIHFFRTQREALEFCG